MPRPIRAAISASALAHNLGVAKRCAGAAKVWAVLKANAYGHGLERAARALGAADGYAVLDLEEAARLRGSGVRKPILLLEGFFDPRDLALIEEHALTPVIHNAEQVQILCRGTRSADLDVYLKANSGMNRLGFAADAFPGAYKRLRELSRVR